MIACSNLSVYFGGVRAVDGVDLACDAGSVLGIVGANGAGKSTLIDALTGFQRPTSGRLMVSGTDVTDWPSFRVARLGLARTWQHGRVAQQMSVLDNIAVMMPNRHASRLWTCLGRRCRQEDRANVRRAMEFLEQIGLASEAHTLAARLSFGQQKAVEIAASMLANPRALVLDEPFSGLAPGLANVFEERIRQARSAGVAVIVVEHDLSALRRVATHVLVLQRGRVDLQGSPAAVLSDPRLLDAFL